MGVEPTTASNDVILLSTINDFTEVIAMVNNNNNKMAGWLAKSGKQTNGETSPTFLGEFHA